MPSAAVFRWYRSDLVVVAATIVLSLLVGASIAGGIWLLWGAR